MFDRTRNFTLRFQSGPDAPQRGTGRAKMDLIDAKL
jgi:hypothetical protein